ncbi:hypothetical protein LAWI1_G008230, partial [Lachnellula willkommii]
MGAILQVIKAGPLINNTINHMPDVLVTNPSSQKVTNTAAFTNGAAAKTINGSDGIGAGQDVYKCYSGAWASYPKEDKWISFEDMWKNANSAMKSSCQNVPSFGAGDSAAQIEDIHKSIRKVAGDSLVDHRFIMAIIMQESSGCVNIDTTVNPDPSLPNNPGLMQSDGGSAFVGNGNTTAEQAASITQMIVDGTQGTADGAGLVQCINKYGNIYEAARCYNSGTVDPSNLNNGEGATNSYVNDVANRMTGWLYADGGSSPFASQ